MPNEIRSTTIEDRFLRLTDLRHLTGLGRSQTYALIRAGKFAAAKARGVRLGNPNGADALRRAQRGNAASVRAITSAADEHARNLRPIIATLVTEGASSLGAIALALNARGILAPRGGRWFKSSVANLLARLGDDPVSAA